MSPSQAALVAQRLRKLLRAGRITHRQLAIGDALLWSCRRPGTPWASASYSALQRLAHVSRSVVAEAVRVLADLGVVRVIRRRVRVGWRSLQATNGYEFEIPRPSPAGPPLIPPRSPHDPTKFARRTVSKEIEDSALEGALAGLGGAISRRDLPIGLVTG